MKKSILSFVIAGLLTAFGYGSVASAADYEMYGSIRAGAIMTDDGTDDSGTWDLGATLKDGSQGGQGLYSRIGIRSSSDLGGGLTAGLHIERAINGADAGFAIRHQNVYLDGDWGRLTIGQQGNSYRSARNWDQTWFLGGQTSKDAGSRVEGIKYSSNLSGPFNFTVMGTGNDGGGENSEDAVDMWIASAAYDVGPVKINVAHETYAADGSQAESNTAIGVNGSTGSFDWYAAYQTATANEDTTHADGARADSTSIGGFVSFGLSDSDKVYVSYATHDLDDDDKEDPVETILGYSHSLGSGAMFHAEYLTSEDDDSTTDDSSTLILAVRVGF